MHPSTLIAILTVAFAVSACDQAVGLPVADARPMAAVPALHPAPGPDAVVDGHVHEYSQ